MIGYKITNHYTVFKIAGLLLLVIGMSSKKATGQFRNFAPAFSDNFKGDIAIFGNTLMNLVKENGTVDSVAMNGNSADGNSFYDNGSFGASNMQYADIDGNSGFGIETRNSSSADLMLPAGKNTIKLARLYWGGRVLTSDFNINVPANQTIKIRKGTTGGYREYNAAQFDKNVNNAGTPDEFYFYQAYADITEMVKQKGGGTYTVGNGAFSTGAGGDFGNYGGWSIVVVYENPALAFSSIRLYDGFQQVYIGGGATTTNITLTGLDIPSTPLNAADAQMGLISWEGDSRFNGDQLSINYYPVGNALNPVNNPMNGTITQNGVHVTTKKPNYTDQMGIDIDRFDVGTGYGILPNATEVSLQFGTNQDQYFSGVLSFVVRMKDPEINITKIVADSDGDNFGEPGEVLTYTIKGTNTGGGNANEMVLRDTLPSTITFLPNSLTVNFCPGVASGFKSDVMGDDIAEYDAAAKAVIFRLGNAATSTNGGSLAPGKSFEIEFKAIVNTPAAGQMFAVVNVARLKAISDAQQVFIDDATAVINLQEPEIINYQKIYIPKAFTPNNDGLNDYWKIPSLAAYPLAEVKIYNRFGRLMFFNKGYTMQWDGKLNGTNQPAGAYPYVVDLKNGDKLYTGTLVLYR